MIQAYLHAILLKEENNHENSEFISQEEAFHRFTAEEILR